MAIKAFYLRNIEGCGEIDIVHWLLLDCHILGDSPQRRQTRQNENSVGAKVRIFIAVCLLISQHHRIQPGTGLC
jgi:hypothetical protein